MPETGIDIMFDGYMWVEWGSAFDSEQIADELSACWRREYYERLGF